MKSHSMRIGIDANCWSNRRGFGRFVRELVGAMVALRSGDEFVLFADRQTVDLSKFPEGCRVVVAETSAAASQAASADGRRSIKDVWAMRRLVKREPLDVMFFPAVYSYFPIADGVPCAVTFHDVIAETLPHLIFHTRRSRWFWNLKSRLALKRSTRVVTVSEASKQGLMGFYKLPADRVSIISEAASEPFASLHERPVVDVEVLRRHGVESGQRYFLYVGGISPHKNIGTLLEGFARIHAEPALADVRLIVVGDYAGDVFRTCYDELCGQIKRLGITRAVHFPGYVPDDDLVHLYAGAQAFVFPSYLEGFGLPAVEAMACGAAVVASNRGSLPEVLNGAGCMFDPENVQSLAEALKRVLMDDQYRAELQQRSLKRAAEFSWTKAARETMQILSEIAN